MAPARPSGDSNDGLELEVLCSCIINGTTNVDTRKLSKVALQILMSSDAHSTSNSFSDVDELTLIENVKCQIQLVYSNKHATTRFENIYKKLKLFHSTSSCKLDILKFLLKLSELGGRRPQNANVNVFHTSNINRPNEQSDPMCHLYSTSRSQYSHSSNTLLLGHDPSISSNLSFRKNSTPIPKTISRVSVSEKEIIGDLIFCLQGLEGKFIKSDGKHNFKMDPKVYVDRKSIVLSIMELGFLYNTISPFTTLSRHKGFVWQGLVCALREQLASYYHSLSLIHSEACSSKPSQNNFIDSPMFEERNSSLCSTFSLSRLMTWARPQISQFQCLTDVLGVTDGLTGGELISSVARYIHVGNAELYKCVTSLLCSMTRPFFLLISEWMVEGTLRDPHGEFFVCEDNNVNVWEGKYRLSESKIPTFMSKLTAEQILRAGICINFLNHVCDEKTPLSGTRKILREMETNGDLLCMVKPCNQLSALIENAYIENSKMVLDVLVTKFGLYHHLQGLRRYMLLGQGDFIHCLMKLLIAELNKPASHLHSAYLHEILDAAIRGTNAQFDDKDVLARLTIKTLVVSSKDLGWDIFVLDYNLNGPLEQILRGKDSPYSTTFKFLWSMKRLDYILSIIWEEQVFSTKKLRKMKELSSLLKQGSGLISEMVHFSHQFQYYISFEVVETAWQKFEILVHQATSLRTLIEEHRHFLRTILKGTMQDENSKHFKFHLASITSCILELKNLQEFVILTCEKELKRRTDLELKIEEYGTCEEEQRKNERALVKFRMKLIPDMKAQYTSITKSYHTTLKKFLLDLSTHPDVALKLLSNRLDFNEHYQRSHAELIECVKFRRTSDYNASSAP